MQLLIFSLIVVHYAYSLQLYNHGSTSLSNPAWMGQLDNGIPIRQLSIMGTHSSMGTGTWGDAFQTQGNSLTTQMMMGFRALDIRCRHYNNQFPVHDRLVYLNTNLGAVLATVRSFLLAYPTEAILMHIVQEYTASGNSRTFEQTYVSYRDAYADIIWAPTTQNPLLGEVRGKVVIIQDFTASAIYGLLYTTFGALPHKVYSTNWDQYDHWLAVKSFLASTNTAGVSRISFWTGNTGSLPYFVASGKSSPGNNDPRLLTGATTILGNVYPDFPRVACLFGLCSIPFQGINILAYNYLASQNYGYLGIVFTDFLGDSVLSKSISLNTGKFTPCPSSLLTQGCTYCTSSAQCLGCNSTTHYVYVPGNSTCASSSGYFLNWTSVTVNNAVECNVPMSGCLTCSSDIVCTECDVLTNYMLMNNTCGAAYGYYLDALEFPVKCPIIGCYQCQSASVCITCSAINNYVINVSQLCQCDSGSLFTQHPSAPACICLAGYFLSNGTCEPMPLCSDPNSGCLSCSATPSCLLCDASNHFETDPANSALCRCENGYFFNGSDCFECNISLSGACLECASSDLCLSCVANFTLQNGDCVCLPEYYQFDSDTCLQCQVGCLRCTTSPDCVVCDSGNNFTMVGTICKCLAGMFLNVAQCQPCGTMPGCLTCDMNGCTSCDPTFGFSLNSTLAECVCDYGYFINSMEVCEQCTALGCLDCTAQDTCTACNSFFNLISGVCDQICGDGVIYVLPCDDGNTQDGDGCSSTCQVETDYTCVGGTSTSPSSCSFSGTLVVTITRFEKDPTDNKVYLRATVTPALAQLAAVDFNNAFVVNFPVASRSTSYSVSTGTIDMQFIYDEPLNDMVLSADFVPPMTAACMYMQKTSTTLPSVTSNNLALKVYSTDLYDITGKQDQVVMALGIISLCLFALCLFLVSKLMGVQMILIFQIAYASLLMVEKKELLMVSLRNLWIANGYNNLIADNAAIGLPQRVSEIYYKGSFLANFNLNIVVVLLPLLVGLVLTVVGKFRKQKKTRVRGYSTLKEWQISSLLFVQLHLGISLCLAYKYNSSNILGLICGGLFYLFIIVLVVLLGKSGKNFGQYKYFFKRGTFTQNWYIVVAIFRMCLGFTIGLLWEEIYCFYAVLGICGFWAVFGIIVRPYLSNVRPIVNSLLVVAIVAVYCVSGLYKDSSEVTFLTSYLPLILISTLGIALIFNFICFIVYKVAQYRKEQKKLLTQETLGEDEESSKQIDQAYIMHLKQQLKDSPAFLIEDEQKMDEDNPLKIIKKLKKKSMKENIIELRENLDSNQKINNIENQQSDRI